MDKYANLSIKYIMLPKIKPPINRRKMFFSINFPSYFPTTMYRISSAGIMPRGNNNVFTAT